MAVAADEIAEFLRRKEPDSMCYDSAHLRLLYNAVLKLNLQPGKDISFMYIGVSFLCPICSHVASPFRQVGREMITQIVDCCRWDRPMPPERIFYRRKLSSLIQR